MGQFVEIIKYIWQLPQNIAALIYRLYLEQTFALLKKGLYKGIKVYTKSTSGSVSLGNYIFISERANDATIGHEWGHTRQSLMLGPLYLLIIGIPSLLWAITHRTIAPDKSYYWFYTERWANKLAWDGD